MKLHKSRTNRVLYGVCGGLSESLDLNVLKVRMSFAAFILLTRTFGIIVYMLLGVFLPYDIDNYNTSSRNRQQGGGFSYSNPSRQNKPKEEDYPFDISNAQDVDIDCRHDGMGYNEDDFYKQSLKTKDEDYRL